MIKAIIFDYDGVLADSLDSVISRWNEISRVYGNSTLITKEFVRNNRTGNWRKFQSEKMGVPEDKTEISSELFKQLGEKDESIKLFSGIDEIVEALSESYELYIISSNYSSIIRRELENYKIQKYFKGIAGHEEIGQISKPDPRFILDLLPGWGLKTDEIVYLGDTSDEVECGKSAGVKTIGCTWGYQSRSLIEQSNPDAIADDPLELSRLIKELSSNH